MTMTTMAFVALSGVGVLSMAAAATLLLGRASASLRHLIWTAALGALVAIPVLEASPLRVEVTVPAGWIGADIPSGTLDAAERRTSAPVIADRDRLEGASSSTVAGASATSTPASARARTVAATVPKTDASRTAPSTSSAAASPALPSWPSLAAASWGLGALVLLLGTILGHMAAHRLSTRHVERPLPEACRRFAELCLDLGLRRPVRLVVSSRIDVPATWGLLRSTVVLPRRYEGWSRETLDRVLLHELAHVRRGDCRAYLLGALARALHWPNPLAWIALARQREESERACDDLVLAHGDAPSRYAEDLVGLVRSLRPAASLPAPLLTMAAESGFGRRVRAILNPELARDGVGRRSVLGAGAAALCLAVATTVLVPVAGAQEPAPEPAVVGTAGVERGSPPAAPGPDSEPEPDSRPTPRTRSEPHPRPSLEQPVFDADALPMPSEPGPLPEPGPMRAAVSASWTPLDRLVAPQSQELCVFRADGPRSTSISSDDDEMRIRWETDDCRVDVDIEGEVVFLPDDSGVESMGSGAVFEIEERIGRSERRARFQASSGSVARRYWVDGDEAEWSAEAERWIAAILPELFRHTTINAEARVRRMIEEGGADRVFSEVETIRSEHVASTYLELLMEHGELGVAEYVRVIDAAGRLESDHNAGELLIAVVERGGLQPAFQEPLLRAAEGLGSDHQKTRVLETLLRMDLDPAQLDAVVASTRTIDSDHGASTVLAAIARNGRLDALDRAAFLDALEGIGSDHAKGEVVRAFLDAGPLQADEVVRVLEMTQSIDSDHEHGTILQRVAREYRLSGPEATAYLRSAAGIGSDHQVAETAQAILENGDVGAEQLELVLRLTEGVGSDHQRAATLGAVIQSRELDAFELRSVVDVALGIGSDHQLAATLSLLAEDERLDEEGVLLVLDAARGIGSDHQLASVMTALARRYAIGGAARTLYGEMADSMSRHQRDEVLAALVR